MPRLFTGLDISDEAADALLSIRGGLSGARWITPDNYHITLRFIGDVDESMARDVFNTLARISRAPIPITITGITAFGGDRPRALVASVLPTPALMELQAEHERLMRRIGLPSEPRKFTPHVTLARLRDTSPFELANFLGAMTHFPALQFTVDAFNVFSSRASVGGGPYIVEASYPLFRHFADEQDRRSA
jgi:RNA 2',3'-cyclic 3'-phosphodiesterase